MSVDYYKELGVPRTADAQQIKEAYRQLAKKYHPDSNSNDKVAEEKFKKINEAYSVLSDPSKRKKYDDDLNNLSNSNHFNNNKGYANYPNTTTFTKEDLFNSLFAPEINRFKKELNDYLLFLNEMDVKFREYNYTLKKEIELASTTPFILSYFISFREKMGRISDEYKSIKAKAKAHDDFCSFYEKANQEMKNLYNRELIEKAYHDYLNVKNRTAFEPERYRKPTKSIEKILFDLKIERDDALIKARLEVEEQGMDFDEFLKVRNLEEKNISFRTLKKIREMMQFIRQIQSYLLMLKIDFDQFIKLKGKPLIEITHQELKIIKQVLEARIQALQSKMMNDGLEQSDEVLKK